MMHYRIHSELNQEKCPTIGQNDPERIPTLPIIKKLLIYGRILVPKHAPKPILHVFPSVKHRIHVRVVRSKERTVSFVGVLGHLDEGKEAEGDDALEGTYLEVEVFLVEGLATNESFFDCMGNYV